MYNGLQKEVALGLFQSGVIVWAKKQELIELNGGSKTSHYCDFRMLQSAPIVLERLAELCWRVIQGRNLKPELLSGTPLGSTQIVTLISQKSGIPVITPRSDPKEHGLKKELEGKYQPGQRALAFDDVLTSGISLVKKNILILKKHGLVINEALVVINRQQQGAEKIARVGVRLHALFRIQDLMEFYVERRLIPHDFYRMFLREQRLIA